jgi:hypothetical protein
MGLSEVHPPRVSVEKIKTVSKSEAKGDNLGFTGKIQNEIQD